MRPTSLSRVCKTPRVVTSAPTLPNSISPSRRRPFPARYKRCHMLGVNVVPRGRPQDRKAIFSSQAVVSCEANVSLAMEYKLTRWRVRGARGWRDVSLRSRSSMTLRRATRAGQIVNEAALKKIGDEREELREYRRRCGFSLIISSAEKYSGPAKSSRTIVNHGKYNHDNSQYVGNARRI